MSTMCVLAEEVTLKNGDATLQLQLSQDRLALVIKNRQQTLINLTDIGWNDMRALGWKIPRHDQNSIELEAAFPASVEFYRHVTDQQPRVAKVTIARVADGFRVYGQPLWGHKVSLSSNYLGDHFFGLSEPLQPDNQFSPDLTGSSISVDVNSEDAYLHENYASAFSAFYISSFGYGSFFDSFARGRYDFAMNGKNKIVHDSGKLDWYIFPGKNGVDIQQQYFSLIGAPKKIPAWALGPIGWRDQNNGGAPEILDDVKKLRELKIPFGAWFVDRPYSDGANQWSQMNFNTLFKNPMKWISQLRNQEGLEFMSWTSTATFGDTSIGKHLAGKFSYLDLSDEKTVESFQKKLADQQYIYGVKGHKMDRADEAFPVYEDWSDKAIDVASRRNLYPVLMAKVHDQALRKKWGNDQFTFARAAYHRSQPFLSAIWAGDPRTSWEGLQANYANAMRAAFIGFPVWGTDVGGYQGDGMIPPDLYLRWLEAGSMSGLFEIKFDGAGGAGQDRLPWRYDENFQKIFQKICAERMQWIPYLYSLASTSANKGTLMQPLAYRHLTDKNTYDIADEFYLGEAILVAPILNNQLGRDLYLPKGEWIDFNNTAKKYSGGKHIHVDASLDIIPRFIAENSIYVQGNIYQGSDRTWNKNTTQLTITATPAAKEGATEFSYVDLLDGDKIKNIIMDKKRNHIKIVAPVLNHGSNLIVLIDKKPSTVYLNGESVTINFDEKNKQLNLMLPIQKENQIEIVL